MCVCGEGAKLFSIIIVPSLCVMSFTGSYRTIAAIINVFISGVVTRVKTRARRTNCYGYGHGLLNRYVI